MKRTVLVLATLLLVGCGGASDATPTAKVAGAGNFNGSPLPDATVTFYPEKGQPSVGRTDVTGAFQVRTNGQLGAIVGTHQVIVAVAPASAEAPPMDGNEMEIDPAIAGSSFYLRQKNLQRYSLLVAQMFCGPRAISALQKRVQLFADLTEVLCKHSYLCRK